MFRTSQYIFCCLTMPLIEEIFEVQKPVVEVVDEKDTYDEKNESGFEDMPALEELEIQTEDVTSGERDIVLVKTDPNKNETNFVDKNNKIDEALNEKEKEDDKYFRLSKKFLRQHCKDMKLYTTPYLNDVLYLHYKGIHRIESLEEYTGLKCIWLECNGIQRIENLENQTELRCLYLQQNLIPKIENLQALVHLDTLNVSNNLISRIENISCIPHLHNLQISHCRLSTVDDLAHLADCRELSCVDLSHNKITDPAIVDVFEKMENLRVLNLMGNEVIRNITNYRKTLILRLKNLQYLDDRPVFPKDRACAEAWAKGGLEEERAERQRWVDAERKKIMDSVHAMSSKRQENMAKRIQKELDEKGQGEEVDPDTIDWLYGSYKTKAQVQIEAQKQQEAGDQQEDSEMPELEDVEVTEHKEEQATRLTIVDATVEDTEEPETEDIPLIKPKNKENDEGIFSTKKTSKDESSHIFITEMTDDQSIETISMPASSRTEKPTFKPRIEVLGDDDNLDSDTEDSSDDEEAQERWQASSVKEVAKDEADIVKTKKLIEEISDETSDPKGNPGDLSTSNDLLDSMGQLFNAPGSRQLNKAFEEEERKYAVMTKEEKIQDLAENMGSSRGQKGESIDVWSPDDDLD
ncbi:hypothetical protein DPMN_027617 [Dreissena polymorpha]|uniref:Dynein assembly factor 1, axonemal homolog n=2 Tax=Dreissena polymorpha TaxID=45954 RepID=A0A9D4LXD5_DREPO|nr:hypothetical protein DPMN_027617 [Dreissena polymorpha]